MLSQVIDLMMSFFLFLHTHGHEYTREEHKHTKQQNKYT